MNGPSQLASYLVNNGLSLRDFAMRVDTTAANVRAWCMGRTPGIDFILAIKAATGIPVDAWAAKPAKRRAAK